MCGRFNLTRTREVVERFGFVDWHERRIEPRFNIAPSQDILTIVRLPAGPAFVQEARWGLTPFWLPAKRTPPINARAETLSSSPMFRDAQRCLIPASGFYEWQQRTKIPMHIRLRGSEPFAFAGLWLPGVHHDGPPTTAIITTRPNELMSSIHNRMPVILKPEDERVWLDPANTTADQLLAPYPAEHMEAYPVSALVNSFKNDDERLIEPADASYTLSFLS